MSKKTLQKILFLSALLLCVINVVLYVFENLGKALDEGTFAHVIDVGQGDSILLLSEGQAVLVDAGTVESGGRLISYLKKLGLKKLYAAVATHPHADHIGGMAKVIESFPIEHFYMGPETANTNLYNSMLEALEERHITPNIPKPGDKLQFDSGASLTFVGPSDDVPSDNINNRSLITLFCFNNSSMLLMGDAEYAAEHSLIKHYPELKCAVLKAGHHGSDTSSSLGFLQVVKPYKAVISCGLDNDYGHPSPQTLDNLKNSGVTEIHITAQEGSVVIPFSIDNADKEEPK